MADSPNLIIHFDTLDRLAPKRNLVSAAKKKNVAIKWFDCLAILTSKPVICPIAYEFRCFFCRRPHRRKKKSCPTFYITITAVSAWKRLDCVCCFFRLLLLLCCCCVHARKDWTLIITIIRQRKKTHHTTNLQCVSLSFSLSRCLVTSNLYRPFVSFIIISPFFVMCIFVCSKIHRIIYTQCVLHTQKSYQYTKKTI